jgi:hypothetical protein
MIVADHRGPTDDSGTQVVLSSSAALLSRCAIRRVLRSPWTGILSMPGC